MTENHLISGTKEFLEKPSTANFLLSARQFVELLETPKIGKKVFYAKAHTALLDLYSAGHKLEQIELTHAVKFKREATVKNKNANLINKLGAKAWYWDVFDPTEPEHKQEAIVGWLVDDFGDIYHDLKCEFTKIDHLGTDEAVESALCGFKWGFRNHWGNHCISALRCLHHLNYPGKQIVY